MPAFNAPTSSFARSLRIKLMPKCSRGVSGRTHNVIESHMINACKLPAVTCSCKRVRRAAETERRALGKVWPLHCSVHRRVDVVQPRRVHIRCTQLPQLRARCVAQEQQVVGPCDTRGVLFLHDLRRGRERRWSGAGGGALSWSLGHLPRGLGRVATDRSDLGVDDGGQIWNGGGGGGGGPGGGTV